MSRALNPDLRLEYRLRRDIAQPIIPRESTVTPVERPLTASQAWNQWLLSQEPTNDIAEEPVPEEVERTLDIYNKQPDHLCDDRDQKVWSRNKGKSKVREAKSPSCFTIVH